MKRRSKKEEHVDEGWLLPYADMMTLLLALFIVMFAMAKVDDQKFEALSEQFNIILSGQPKSGNGGILPDHPNPNKATEKSAKEIDEDKIVAAGNSIEKDLAAAGHQADIDVNLEADGLRIAIKSGLLFHSGSAKLNSEIESLVLGISHSLSKLDNEVIIAGYTDNVPNQTADYSTNWELSAARAINVMQFLIETQGISEDKVSIQAYGEFRPKVPNNTAENRSKNRRVEIFILRKEQ